jgi:hypothetical protein
MMRPSTIRSEPLASLAVLALLAGLLVALAPACGEGPRGLRDDGVLDFDPDRPTVPGDREATPYTGDDAFVLEAMARYATGYDLHTKLIQRSCSGAPGVCHNQTEYPDLRTAASLIDAIDAPCNVQPGHWSTVFDRCEQLGDRFVLTDVGGREIEIGWIEYVAGEWIDHREAGTVPDERSPGLHIRLKDPVQTDRERTYDTGRFIRTFVNADGDVEDLPFAAFESQWWILGDGRHLMAEVRSFQVDRVNEIMAVGVEQGDMNRNGIFGAREGLTVPMIAPGNPEESYLVARLTGRMGDERVPGTRMPLANEPPSIADMLALVCWIQGLAPGEIPSLAWPIDYGACSYTDDPQQLNLLGDGATFRGRVAPLLEANCGGCHAGQSPAEGLDLVSEGVHARLLEASVQNPNLALVEPGYPGQSYLWLKLLGTPGILGDRMPPSSSGFELTAEALDDIEDWIRAGALDDGVSEDDEEEEDADPPGNGE